MIIDIKGNFSLLKLQDKIAEYYVKMLHDVINSQKNCDFEDDSDENRDRLKCLKEEKSLIHKSAISRNSKSE